jgi:hypothetical protein
MKCIDCSVADLHTALEVHPKMARMGFAKCPTDPMPYRFMGLLHEHECNRFSPAAPESIAKRFAHLNIKITEGE